MYEEFPMQHPFAELRNHALQKLAEEERFYASLAKTGKTPHGNRIDRRPLWAAVAYLAGIYARQPVPDGVTWRGDAWGWLCERAKHLMANETPFDAIVRLALCVRLPPAEALDLLDERAAIREARNEERKRLRTERLREELRRLEGGDDAGGNLPKNVVQFRANGA